MQTNFAFLVQTDRFKDFAMQAAEAEVPASVANKLQEYEYEWNKEANFKLAAAIGEHAHGGNVEYDDD